MIAHLLVLLFLGQAAGSAPDSREADPLTLEVTPRVCFAPGEFRARIRVRHHPDNRRLDIVADAVQYYSSTTKYLDGETDAVRHEQFFGSVPAGTYIVRATLTRSGGEEVVEEVEVIVRGRGDTPR